MQRAAACGASRSANSAPQQPRPERASEAACSGVLSSESRSSSGLTACSRAAWMMRRSAAATAARRRTSRHLCLGVGASVQKACFVFRCGCDLFFICVRLGSRRVDLNVWCSDLPHSSARPCCLQLRRRRPIVFAALTHTLLRTTLACDASAMSDCAVGIGEPPTRRHRRAPKRHRDGSVVTSANCVTCADSIIRWSTGPQRFM